MITRLADIEIYRQIQSGNLLPESAFRVYQALFINGPLTGKALNRLLGSDSAHKRLSELRVLGVVSREHVGATVVWDVTDKLPTRPTKAASAPEGRPTDHDIQKAVDALRDLWKVGKACGIPSSEPLVRVARWLAQGAS